MGGRTILDAVMDDDLALSPLVAEKDVLPKPRTVLDAVMAGDVSSVPMRKPTGMERVQNTAASAVEGFTSTVGSAIEGANLLLGPSLNTPQLPYSEGMADVGHDLVPPVPEAQAEGGVAGFLTNTLPKAVGSTAGFAAAGGPFAAAGLPAWIPAAVAGAMTNGAAGYYEAKFHGADEATQWQSFALNALAGTSEALEIGRLFGKVNTASGGALKRILIDGATEGGQEAGQQAASNLIAQHLYDEDRKTLQGLVENGGAGFLTGIMFGATREVAQRGGPTTDLSKPDSVSSSGVDLTGQSVPFAEQATGDSSELGGDKPANLTQTTGAAPLSSPPSEQGGPAASSNLPEIPDGSIEQPRATSESGGMSEAQEATLAGSETLQAPEAVTERAVSRSEQAPGEPITEARDAEGAPDRTETLPGEQGYLQEAIKRAAPEPSSEEDTVGLRHEDTAKARAAVGVGEYEGRRGGLSDVERHAKALKAFKDDPLAGKRLVDELEASGKAGSDQDAALLLIEEHRTRLEVEAAQNKFKSDPTPANQALVDKALADFKRTADVLDQAGSEGGARLRAQRDRIKYDYSFAAQLLKREVAQGGEPLTAKERATLKEETDAIARAAKAAEEASSTAERERRIKALEATVAELERNQTVRSRRRERHGTRAARRAQIKSRLDEIVKEFARPTANVGADPTKLVRLVEAARLYIEDGILKFSDFADDFVSRTGEHVRPMLQTAWDRAMEDPPLTIAKKESLENADPVQRRIVQLARRQTRYQGNKREFFINNSGLLSDLSKKNLSDVETIFDVYAGGGTYGLTFAAAGATPNVKRIVINEVDPVRKIRLDLAVKVGGDFMSQWDSNPTLRKLKLDLEPLIVKSSSPAAAAMDVVSGDASGGPHRAFTVYKDSFNALPDEAKAAFLALRDVMFSGRTADMERLIESATEDADRIKRLVRRVAARGVSVETTSMDAIGNEAKAMVSGAGRSLVLLDPPYHETASGTYRSGEASYDFKSDDFLEANLHAARDMSNGNVVLYNNKATPGVRVLSDITFGGKMSFDQWERSNGQREFVGVYDGSGKGVDAGSFSRDVRPAPTAEDAGAERGLVGAAGANAGGQVGSGAKRNGAGPRGRASVEEASAAISARLKEGAKLTELRPYIDKITESFYADGVTDSDKLADAVHSVLKVADPKITREETVAAISHYGDYKQLSQDEVARGLRQARGELREAAKLSDLAKGIPPKKTGVEYPEPTGKQRRLAKKVREEMKRLGLKTTDPATQIKSALESAKTRVRNAIDDLTTAIDTRTQLKKGERVEVSDAELVELKAKRAELEKVYAELFVGPKDDPKVRALVDSIADLDKRIAAGDTSTRGPKQGPEPRADIAALKQERAEKAKTLAEMRKQAEAKTAEERTADQVKRLEASLKKLETELFDIAEGGSASAKGPKQGPDTERVAELKRRRADLRSTLADIRDAQNPGLSAEQRAIAMHERAAERRLRAEQERMRSGNFERTAKPKEERIKSPKEIETLTELELAKRIVDRGAFEARQRNRSAAKKVLDNAVAQPAREIKEALSTADVSAVGRQGWALTVQDLMLPWRTPQLARRLGRMFRAFGSEKFGHLEETAIREDPSFKDLKDAGLEFTGIGDPLTPQEEYYQGKWLRSIPFVGHLIKGSERAFVTYMNRLRLDHGKRMIAASDGSKTALRQIARTINVFSGRANVEPGKLKDLMSGSSPYLWAPSLYASRFQFLAGEPLYGGNAHTRRLVAKEYATTLGALGALYGLVNLYARMNDDDKEKPTVSWDPSSADYAKVRIGDTRIDITAGLGGTARLLLREGKAFKKLAMDEKGAENPVQVGEDFLEYKFAPGVTLPFELATGREFATFRKKPRPQNVGEALARVAPLSFRDTYEAGVKQGIPEAVMYAVLSSFGFSMSTYEDKKKR